ncbi:MAG: hypothetical protein SOT09_01245, partial [Candidatus Borkfalkiaceae bacterium]|nr:hypothetical protein [Christensenellaceae bacterium]
EQQKEEFYNGNTYVDTMNPDAIKEFFARTHEVYEKRMGELFGGVIKGVFADEPHRGCFFNGFGQSGADASQRFPYTGRLFAAYKAKFGESIEDKLPEIAFRRKGEEFSVYAYRYTDVCLDLFINAFFIPYSEYCKKRGLKFTGHLLNEDNLAGQALMCGDLAACYYYMDEPGIDNLGSVATHFSAVKTCASVAEQFGKKRVVSELYGATGWQTPFARYKAIGDWQALLGVNSRCPHLSWYTMKGESKRDYPASISVQSAWWEDYAYVEDYFARLSMSLSGESLAETLVIHPVESIWGLPRLGGFSAPFTAKSPLFCEIEKKYRAFGEALVFGGVEFDYGSERLIGKFASVKGKTFILGERSYKRVVVYGLYTIRKETLSLLRDFAAYGGELIFGGGYPSVVGGEKYDGGFFGEYIEGGEAEVASQIEKRQTFPVKTTATSGVMRRLKGKSEFSEFTLALVNTDREKSGNAFVKIADGYVMQAFDARSGRIDEEKYSGEVSYDLAEAEEKILFINRCAVTSGGNRKSDETTKKSVYKSVNAEKTIRTTSAIRTEKVGLPAEFSYKLSEPNALVLDRAEAFIDEKHAFSGEMILIDDYLRKNFNLPPRGRNMYQPWFREDKCEKRRIKLYIRFFAEQIPSSVRLVGEDLDKWRFLLGGKTLSGEITDGYMIDRCFSAMKINSSLIKIGENVLEAQCDFDGSPAIENFYLSGNFGVSLRGEYAAITALPKKITLGDIGEQGLPFYTGKITYKLPLEKGEYEISVCYGGATLAVGFGGENMAFPPYRATFASCGESDEPLTLTLSRKNLFGTLHRDIADPPSTVPVHFRLEGEHRREEFVTIKQGIFSLDLRRIRND